MANIKYLDEKELEANLPWLALIDSLQVIFCKQVHEPVRHHHFIDVPNEPQATLLLMPAWLEGEYLGVKQVNVFPGNNARNQPALNGTYLLSSAKTGEPLVQLDADALTARRTAAASALASKYLSKQDAKNLLVIGSGRLARALIQAHSAVRPIESIQVWSRNQLSSEKLVQELIQEGLKATVCITNDLPEASANADIISCATMSTDPIILGEWLQVGVHIDLVGAFRKDMRETDDEVMTNAKVFVDTRAGALAEAGDITQAIESGAIHAENIVAELSELCAQEKVFINTQNKQHITVFKSVGAAREDLAAAILAYEQSQKMGS